MNDEPSTTDDVHRSSFIADRSLEPLTPRDRLFILTCAAIFLFSLVIALRYFSRAFPEATIEFRYDRTSSRAIAERLLAALTIEKRGMKHAAVFESDDDAKVFLERSLGLEKANAVMRHDVHLWYWHHRWFRPLQEEEYAVDIAPTGEIVSFSHKIPEDRAIATAAPAEAQQTAESFLARAGVLMGDLHLVAQSERRLPKRLQRIFTWDSKSVQPAGAPYRYSVTVDGNVVGEYTQRLRVPEQWQRAYRELRSKNHLAGNVDAVFLAITIIAALGTFIVRLRRGDMRIRFLIAIGAVSIVLVTGVSLNSYPIALAQYETTTSFAAFVGQLVVFSILQAIGTAILLMIICGAGEVLYRERLPSQLAISRLWTPRALASKRVFRSFVLGYALVAFFLAYQVVFYIVAGKFGAWAPAEIPYDDMLNTALPWVAVLFAGFFPSLSEELLSRAFSIPFFQRILHSRAAAIIVAGLIWGFGHATYPNQPFYIRGLEVGFAGILLGVVMDVYGLLPLLIWHYTVDAFYTSLLLFRSHNGYYIASAAISSFVFAIPMLISIALYIRNRGFIADDDLTNATLPVSTAPERGEAPASPPLPAGIGVTRGRTAGCAVAVLAAAVAIAFRPPSPSDAVDFAITKSETKAIATRHMREVVRQPMTRRVIATPVEGFRSWDRQSRREDGGAPGGYDSVAADYVVRNSSVRTLVDAFRSRVLVGTWSVRFFTPMVKEESFVEVDPRTARVVGYHKYQDERRPGPALERDAALDLGWRAFPAYGVDSKPFELKEALAFQQPKRRDWLFHFEERTPIAASAHRRVVVRVAGAEVTQFTTTVHIPDIVYREASTQTLANVVLMLLRIVGAIAILALVVTGFVIASLRRRVAWRRAARWTLVLAIIPIVGAAASYESNLFVYDTSVRWETFMTNFAVTTVRDIALKIGLLFLAIAGIDAAHPFALGLLSREGRRRFGRGALLASVTAVALFAVARVVMQAVAATFPRGASTGSLNISHAVAIPLPVIGAIGDAVYASIIGAAAVALFVFALERRAKPLVFAAATMFIIFCMTVDASATMPQMPLMLVRAAVTGALAWLIARFVLGRNALAYPLTIFIASLLQSASAMLHNHRVDLQANAAAIIVVILALTIWIAFPRLGAASPEISGANEHA